MTVLDNFTCTEPADREATEALILKYRGEIKAGQPKGILPGHLKPQFIWCGSPQSVIVMVKLVSDLHESSPPPPPPPNIKGGGRVPDWQLVGIGERGTYTNIYPVSRITVADDSPLGRIRTQISASLTLNPNVELFGHGLTDDRNIVQRAIETSQPHLADIKLDQSNLGRRLELKKTYLGQHKLDSDDLSFEARLAELCGWVWDYGSHIFISERTSEFHYEPFTLQLFNARQFPIDTVQGGIRLHNENGPAVAWPDGTEIYAIHGVVVPDFVVNDPRQITRYKINHENNQEVRRIMMDRYKLGQNPSGAAAYMLDSGARAIDHDEAHGTLHWLPRQAQEAEGMVVLEVVNSTPEPDGSFKHYYLRVPPHITTSLEARAWTFGIDPNQFKLLVET